MRTTIVLDDELLAKAQAFTSLQEKSSLVTDVTHCPRKARKNIRCRFLADGGIPGIPSQTPKTSSLRHTPRSVGCRRSGRDRYLLLQYLHSPPPCGLCRNSGTGR